MPRFDDISCYGINSTINITFSGSCLPRRAILILIILIVIKFVVEELSLLFSSIWLSQYTCAVYFETFTVCNSKSFLWKFCLVKFRKLFHFVIHVTDFVLVVICWVFLTGSHISVTVIIAVPSRGEVDWLVIGILGLFSYNGELDKSSIR